MHAYGVRDVEKLLGLPRTTIRALINAGFVSPARGARNAWQFSFQDLIVLRTAQALATANVPHRRITKSLKELRRHLPAAMPLSGLRIGAVGDEVVVREGGQQWLADTGQYLLAFDGDPLAGSLSIIEARKRDGDSLAEPAGVDELPIGSLNAAKVGPKSAVRRIATASANDDVDWFDRAVALETDDVDAAVHAYERALAANPRHLEAYVNFGRLLHESGRLAQAERVYRAALLNTNADAIVHFNLAVLLEDMERDEDAVVEYEAALQREPTLADGHYNLALLYEQLKKPKDAIRHMAQYRRLLAGKR